MVSECLFINLFVIYYEKVLILVLVEDGFGGTKKKHKAVCRRAS